MLDTTSADKDSLFGEVVSLDIVDEIIALNALNVFLGSQNGTSEGLALESSSMKMVKDDFLTVVCQYGSCST